MDAVEKHGYQNTSEFCRHAVRLLMRVHNDRSEAQPARIEYPDDMDDPLAYAGRHGTMLEFVEEHEPEDANDD